MHAGQYKRDRSWKATVERRALARAYFNPHFQGLESLNLKRPALWVGNHTLFGLLDVPLMAEHTYTRLGDMIPPLARGLGLTLSPRPQHYYFGFGRRIRTRQLGRDASDADAVWRLRARHPG
jgi:hypothetical protein